MSWLEQQASRSWHTLAACNATPPLTANASSVGADEQATPSTMWVGILLSVLADAIIAVSLNVQKLAHNRNADPKTGKPVQPFVKLPLWWVGILMNALGELGNMLAYGFAPAAIVAPVGSVGVLVNELIAVCYLKEPLRKRDLVGLVGVVVGVVLIILGVPESEMELNAHTLLTTDIFLAPRSYWYIVFLILLVIVLMVHMEPRYAQRHILVWLMLCSIISSMTVIACRGFASMVTQVPEDCASAHCQHSTLHPPCSATIGHWLFWVQLIIIIITAIWSAFYLNRAMQVFGNTETVPVYYCTFTLMSIIGGAIVFNEFGAVTGGKAAMFGMGIVLALAGVVLITSNRSKSQQFRSMSHVDEKLHQLEDDSKVTAITFGHAGASAVQAKFIHDVTVDEEWAKEKMMAAHYPGTLCESPSNAQPMHTPRPPGASSSAGSSEGWCNTCSPTRVVELSCVSRKQSRGITEPSCDEVGAGGNMEQSFREETAGDAGLPSIVLDIPSLPERHDDMIMAPAPRRMASGSLAPRPLPNSVRGSINFPPSLRREHTLGGESRPFPPKSSSDVAHHSDTSSERAPSQFGRGKVDELAATPPVSNRLEDDLRFERSIHIGNVPASSVSRGARTSALARARQARRQVALRKPSSPSSPNDPACGSVEGTDARHNEIDE